MLFALLMACALPYPNACEQYVLRFCDVCELEEWEKPMCTCFEEGELKASDFPDGSDINNDDAQLQCDIWIEAAEHPSPDNSAGCKQGVELLKDHEQDACDYLGGL
jgi:hypothetical protein